MFYNHQDILLGNITQSSARNILENYSFTSFSMFFIMIVSVILLSFVGTIVIEKEFNKKLRRIKEDELIKSSVALKTTLAVALTLIFISAWSIIPNLPLSGWMLDNSASSYTEMLLGTKSPFRDGFMLIILCISLVCSYIYGKMSRNIKDNREFNKSISKTFQNTGFIFAGLFFASIMINILEWTNLQKVLSFFNNICFND